MTPRDVHLRTELVHHLKRDLFPADRERLLARLREDSAHEDVTECVGSLPEGDHRYADIHEVAKALGLERGPRADG